MEKWYTTLNDIKKHKPCTSGWEKLLKNLGKTKADDEPLHILTILESNGLKDTLWACRCLEGVDKELRLFAADCAEHVLPIFGKKYPNDARPREAIQAARLYAQGKLSHQDLEAFRAAARDARDAAALVTIAAARAAYWFAAWAASDAASDAGEAGESAAHASRAAAHASRAASNAALAAWAAWAAEEQWQIERLKQYVNGGEE